MDPNKQFQMTANPDGRRPGSMKQLVHNFKHNFLTREIEIVPGLKHNQYEVVKRTYFYLYNQFESGPTDDDGNPKYFYDLMTHRNDQMSKSVNLGTKDVYIKAETENAYLKSWLLRREFMGYAKTTGFGVKLNEISDDIPVFGTFVWKKIKDENGNIDVANVELINLMNDPAVKNLRDGMVIERHLLCQYDLLSKKVWDQDEVQRLINSGKSVHRINFLSTDGQQMQSAFNFVDEYTPYYEVYEMWGEIPEDMYKAYKRNQIETETGVYQAPDPTSSNRTVYVMAIVAGVDDGNTEHVLYIQETDRENFPYKEVHSRRRKGRWLGVGNYELCFPLIEKANELTNRFYQGLRIGSIHVYQTRDNLAVHNVYDDMKDGDITTSKSEITAIPTEIRAFSQYVDELKRIEDQADRLCNSYEIVSGESLPSGTPYKLGSQQLSSANKTFEYIREKMGLFIEDVFNVWMLPSFAQSLTKEHILDLTDSIDDLEIYNTGRRKLFQYDALKRYILMNSAMPTADIMDLVGTFVKDQLAKGPKQVKVELNYYLNLKYSIKVVVTGENDAKATNLETLTNIFQNIVANPVVLQDERLMKILNIIMEQAGVSPLDINSINQRPTNPALNPAFQGGDGMAKIKQLSTGATVPAAKVPQAVPAQ